MTNETLGYTLSEAANQCRVSDHTMRAWLKAGVGPKFIKVGRKYLFSRESLVEFLNGNQTVSA